MNTSWTTILSVKESLRKKWDKGHFICEAVNPAGVFPLRIPLRGPRSSELRDTFALAQQWVRQYLDPGNQRYFTVQWDEINNRDTGKNSVPVAVEFMTPDSVASFIGKTKELKEYIALSKILLSCFPPLNEWVSRNPFQLIAVAEVIDRLINVTLWILKNPLPGVYLRQITISDVDTKFIEQHKKNLYDWFDIVLTDNQKRAECSGIRQFESRYGFLSKPQLIRFRILDQSCYVNGLSDLTLRADEFCKLEIDIDTVFVTENDINGIAFPMVSRSIVLFGRGYGFDSLRECSLLKNKKILYWGDIDTHGFAILNQFRSLFPETKSILMDKETLLKHKNFWVQEQTPTGADLTVLTEHELEVYDILRYNRLGNGVRLEQEVINFDCLNKYLHDGF